MIVDSFQLPNELVDRHMAEMPPLALKCYLFIVRKTVGWQKQKDRIAQSQFIEYTGAQKSAISDSVRWLEDHNMIVRHMEKGKITEYELNRSKPPQRTTHDQKVNRHSGSSKPPQRNDPPATAVTTKDTITKDTITKVGNWELSRNGSDLLTEFLNLYPKSPTSKREMKRVWALDRGGWCCEDKAPVILVALALQLESCENFSNPLYCVKPEKYIDDEKWVDKIVVDAERAKTTEQSNYVDPFAVTDSKILEGEFS